jgi:hypothetical protein
VSKFKKACRKNSPSNFKKYFDQAVGWSKTERQYLNRMGKEDETDEGKKWAPHKWFLCHDKGNRWGIMTTNGSSRFFSREEDWAPYEGDKIILNRTLIKKSRRKSKRYLMTMDVLEGRMGPRHCENYGTINHTIN